MLKKKYIDCPVDFENEIIHINENYPRSCGEYNEIIENMYDNKPDKRTKQFAIWKNNISKLIKECNEKFGKIWRLPK